MGLMGSAPPIAGADSERLFAAGVTYVCCGAWPLAYDCFRRSTRVDAPTRYNQALCCFMTGWYEESYRLLGEAERLLDDKPGEGRCPDVPSALSRQLPEARRRWEAATELPRCPLLPAASRDTARRCPHADPTLAGRGCLPSGPPRRGTRNCRPPRTQIPTN